MPFAAQSRLLRVLAEGEVLPVGGSTPQKVDFRVISASHRPLNDMVRTGAFREDLYYRLNAAVLTLPALSERDDFPWLLERILEKHGMPGRPLTLSNAARLTILHHRWPGNIRELDNTIAFAAALCDDGLITVEDLPEQLTPAASPPMVDSRGTDLRALLVACNGNISEAARRLGVDRTTLHRRMRRLGIGKPH
jgi:transcriptional regulator of acetoin/glycerol metabolism